jgi:hypothetical protein
MKDFIVDSLSEIDLVTDDIADAECIGEPFKSLLLRYLSGRKDGLESVLDFMDYSEAETIEAAEVTEEAKTEPDVPAEEAKETAPEPEKDKPLTRNDPRIKEIMNLADELILKLKAIEPLERGRKYREIIRDWIQANDECRDEYMSMF